MPYPKFIYLSKEELETLELETTLKAFNPNIKLSDLVRLNGKIMFPRDCCTYYKHRTEHMFLSCYPTEPDDDDKLPTIPYEWEDITNDYDWENTFKVIHMNPLVQSSHSTDRILNIC